MHRAIFALFVLFACGGALAQAQTPDPAAPQARPAAESPAPAGKPSDDTKLELQKPDDETPKAADSWWQKIVREAPNCKSFTDGCRTCSQTICSNIGIACQPKEWSCNDADPDAKSEVKPDAESDSKPDSKQ
jgi:hypothetical protein